MLGEEGMQLTRYSDYSLRLLMYLAMRPEGATITEVAERYNISRNHLVRIVHDLGKQDWIATARGRAGGLRLVKRPEDINLGTLLRDTEANFDLVECFNPEKNACVIAPSCRLKKLLFDAREAFLAELDKYTLADIVVNREALLAHFDLN
jgi:Rrf2 family nitric oxide-sensitive transcriptional repressor